MVIINYYRYWSRHSQNLVKETTRWTPKKWYFNTGGHLIQVCITAYMYILSCKLQSYMHYYTLLFIITH